MQVLTSTPYATPEQKYRELMDREYKEGQRNNNLVLFSRAAVEAGFCIDGFYEDIQKRDEKLNTSTITTYEEVERAWHRASSTDKPKSISGIRGKIHAPAGVVDGRFGGKFGDEAKAAPNLMDYKQLWSFFPGVFTGNDVVYCGPFDASRGYFRQAEAWGRLGNDTLEILGSVPYFAVNPLDDSGERTDKHVTEFKHFLLEIDPETAVNPRSSQEVLNDPEDPRHKQLEIMAGLIDAGIPIKSITYSGNKSFHAIVALKGIEDLGSWEDRVKLKLYPYFEAMGFDSKVSNPSRLTRLPGVLHENGIRQDLVYLNPKARPLTPEQIIEKLKPLIELDQNLYYLDDKGRWRLDENAVERVAKEMGYRMYLSDPNKETYNLVKIRDKRAQITSLQGLRGEIAQYIRKNQPEVIGIAAKGIGNLITDNWCDFLEKVSIETHTDTLHSTFLYFQNGVLEVTAEGERLIPYSEIDTPIWTTAIIPRNYVPEKGLGEGMFEELVRLMSNNKEDRIFAMQTAIGSLVNRFKNIGNPFAVILTDESLEEDSGRTGKGIVGQAIQQMRNMINLDYGDSRQRSLRFSFQGVNESHDIIHIEDADAHFNFRGVFVSISGDMTVEQKNIAEKIIPFERAPKIFITTNHIPRGATSSHAGRRRNIEVSNFFDHENTVYKHFNAILFSDTDWGEEQWQSFYRYMISCIKAYHANGNDVTEWVSENYGKKALKGDIGAAAFENIGEALVTWQNEGGVFHNDIHDLFRRSGQANIGARKAIQRFRDYCKEEGLELPKARVKRRTVRDKSGVATSDSERWIALPAPSPEDTPEETPTGPETYARQYTPGTPSQPKERQL